MDEKETKRILKGIANVFTTLGEKNSLLGEFRLEDYTLKRRKWDTSQIYIVCQSDTPIVEFHANTKNSKVFVTIKNQKELEPLKKFVEAKEMIIALDDAMSHKKQPRSPKLKH